MNNPKCTYSQGDSFIFCIPSVRTGLYKDSNRLVMYLLFSHRGDG